MSAWVFNGVVEAPVLDGDADGGPAAWSWAVDNTVVGPCRSLSRGVLAGAALWLARPAPKTRPPPAPTGSTGVADAAACTQYSSSMAKAGRCADALSRPGSRRGFAPAPPGLPG
nr:hypothetical protein GCM10020241_50220 [Streptoalloteichus tenebrarius]